MSESNTLYKQSLLAMAAYADITPSSDISKALEHAGMSPTQAADFASNWSVVDTYADVSGVAATVFPGERDREALFGDSGNDTHGRRPQCRRHTGGRLAIVSQSSVCRASGSSRYLAG